MINEDQNLLDAGILRRRAEEQLKERNSKPRTHILEPDINKLVHELQVHQIELEMQNEELLRAYETAENALRKYTLFYELAPLGYFILDENANITELNFMGAELLDNRRLSLVNRNFKFFVSPESLPVFNNFFADIYARNTNQTCEVMLAYNNKPLCKVYMDGIVTDDNQCLLTLIDRTGPNKL